MSHNMLSQQELSMQPFALRGSDRMIARLQRRTVMELAQIAHVAAAQAARVEAIACVGRRALFEAALVTQTEQSLALLVPLASGRLQTIADVATLGIAEVVADTVRRVTR